MDQRASTPLQIGAWYVDPVLGQMTRGGEVVRLQPRTMGILLCLARHAGEVVSIEHLLTEVWAGVIVTQDSVYQAVASLREALGDDRKNPTYIATVPRLGYRMLATVAPAAGPPSEQVESSLPTARAGNDPREASIASSRRSSRFYMAIAIAGCVTIVVGYLLLARPSSPPSTIGRAAVPERSVAVLPFLDMSEGKDQQYFADGMTEELIDLLAKVPSIRVPARTSSFYFKTKQATVADIAKALGVANVLEGSVRKSGNTLRITAQLIRADNGYHLWSETYDRPLTDIFKVQDDIAAEIVKMLKASLSDDVGPQSSPAKNSDAYLWYLKALAMRHGFRSEATAATIVDNLHKSIQEDPTYAPAWAELARARAYQFNAWYLPLGATSPEGHAAASRALELDPDLAAAHVAAGAVRQFFDWDWTSAEQEYRRALELEPRNADILSFMGSITRTLGRLDESREFHRRAVELDPLEERNYAALGILDYFMGKFQDAEAEFRTGHALNANLPEGYEYPAYMRLATGDPQSALTLMSRSPEEPSRLAGLAIIYAALRRTSEANSALAQLEQRYAASWPCAIAEVYANRGDLDQAFAWLERAYRERDTGLQDILSEPLLERVRTDPRYELLLRELKLTP
jgi:TolB-like protein/DNA-binding winged helix-turn-helix (wHTH) protein/Flp pilus assembly protein TadD